MIGYSASTSQRMHKERLLGLARVLEASLQQQPPEHEQMVNAAAMIRNMVREEGAVLSTQEKTRLVRTIALAKARVYAEGTAEAYRMYKKLDAISDEVIRLL
ncbi:hypothetical protein GF318_03880 [Candidatus Micrarchaeota archaeon]|nr:hypothetical protein [Candidatus Micrarchaeota archaeon]